jgi:hypothetical protein
MQFTASTAKYSALLIISVLTSYLAYDYYTEQSKSRDIEKMAELKVGDSLPSGVTFSYVPYTPETGDITSCGIPITYDASKGTIQSLLPILQSSRCANLLIIVAR